jgi:Leucine-rich repeat (LRR) protein
VASVLPEAARPTTKPVADPDRRAAEWVKSIGGEGSIVGRTKQVFDADSTLPERPFHVFRVQLAENPRVTDAGLANLSGLSLLRSLQLEGTPITDAGLANLAGLSRLYDLQIVDTHITDAGLAHLANLPSLHSLNVDGTKITDAGLLHLTNLPSLRELYLNRTSVGDAGLRNVGKITGLTTLTLRSTEVTDRGLEHLIGLRKLRVLDLTHTNVGDDGLRPLQKLTELRILTLGSKLLTDALVPWLLKLDRLEFLRLGGAGGITSAGLEELGKLPRLRALQFNGCKTDGDRVEALAKLQHLQELYWIPAQDATQEADVAALKAALPNCRIETSPQAAMAAYYRYYEKATEPDAPADPDRRAAEWVRSIGGDLQICGEGARNYGAADVELPEDPFLVYLVGLESNPSVTDVGLANLAGLTELSYLELAGTRTTDAALAHFGGLSELEYLGLAGTQITGAGLVHLQSLPSLRRLRIGGTPLGDADLRTVGRLKGLTELELGLTTITDRGLEHLVELGNLRCLDLTGVKTGDDGLRHLQHLTELRILRPAGTEVTDAGVPHLLRLGKLEYLELYVGPGHVTAASLEDLGKLPRLKALSLVLIGTNRISSQMIEALAKLPHLRELCVDPDAAEQDVAAVQAALPNCRIEATEYDAAYALFKKYRSSARDPSDPDHRAAEVEGVPGANAQPLASGAPSEAEGDSKSQERRSQEPPE